MIFKSTQIKFCNYSEFIKGQEIEITEIKESKEEDSDRENDFDKSIELKVECQLYFNTRSDSKNETVFSISSLSQPMRMRFS